MERVERFASFYKKLLEMIRTVIKVEKSIPAPAGRWNLNVQFYSVALLGFCALRCPRPSWMTTTTLGLMFLL